MIFQNDFVGLPYMGAILRVNRRIIGISKPSSRGNLPLVLADRFIKKGAE